MLTFTPAGYLTPVGKITTDLPTLERVFVKEFPASTTYTHTFPLSHTLPTRIRGRQGKGV